MSYGLLKRKRNIAFKTSAKSLWRLRNKEHLNWLTPQWLAPRDPKDTDVRYTFSLESVCNYRRATGKYKKTRASSSFGGAYVVIFCRLSEDSIVTAEIWCDQCIKQLASHMATIDKEVETVLLNMRETKRTRHRLGRNFHCWHQSSKLDAGRGHLLKPLMLVYKKQSATKGRKLRVERQSVSYVLRSSLDKGLKCQQHNDLTRFDDVGSSTLQPPADAATDAADVISGVKTSRLTLVSKKKIFSRDHEIKLTSSKEDYLSGNQTVADETSSEKVTPSHIPSEESLPQHPAVSIDEAGTGQHKQYCQVLQSPADADDKDEKDKLEHEDALNDLHSPTYGPDIIVYVVPQYQDGHNPDLPLALQQQLAAMSPRDFQYHVLNVLSLEQKEILMCDESQRRKTFFVNWPHVNRSNLSGMKMAQAGFFAMGVSDQVECAFCRGRLHDWDDDDVPMVEHARLFNFCRFVKGLNCGNIEYRSSHFTRSDLQNVTQFGADFSSDSPNRKVDSHSLGISTLRAAAPRYATPDTRRNTYARWPEHNAQTPERLSEAGFFYVGFDDHVRCFFCAGGLKEWSDEEDPWKEHARYFPNCMFLINTKGKEYIEEVQAQTPAHQRFNFLTATQLSLGATSTQSENQVAEMKKFLLGLGHSAQSIDLAISNNGGPFDDIKMLVDAIYQLEDADVVRDVEMLTLQQPTEQISMGDEVTQRVTQQPAERLFVGDEVTQRVTQQPAERLFVGDEVTQRVAQQPAVPIFMGDEVTQRVTQQPAERLFVGDEVTQRVAQQPAVPIFMGDEVTQHVAQQPAVPLFMGDEVTQRVAQQPAVPMFMGDEVTQRVTQQPQAGVSAEPTGVSSGSKICKLCGRSASHVGLPCGHLIYCDSCQAEETRKCVIPDYRSKCPYPSCGAVLNGTIKVWFA